MNAFICNPCTNLLKTLNFRKMSTKYEDEDVNNVADVSYELYLNLRGTLHIYFLCQRLKSKYWKMCIRYSNCY